MGDARLIADKETPRTLCSPIFNEALPNEGQTMNNTAIEQHKVAYKALSKTDAEEAEKYKKTFYEAFVTDQNKKTVAPWPIKNKWWNDNPHIEKACEKYKVLKPLMIQLVQRPNLRKAESCIELFDGTRFKCDRENSEYAVLRKRVVPLIAKRLKVSERTIERQISALVKCDVLKNFPLGGKEGQVIAVGYYQKAPMPKEINGKTEIVYRFKLFPFLTGNTANKFENFKI